MAAKKFPEEVFENPKCTLRIIPELCKGCAICIEFCPVKALSLDRKRLIVTASAMEKCIACGMCELRCPDFAIVIDKKEKEKQ
ncbi:MAG TPA: 4Fe-4S binding protein [bacterium]|nr:4Fe-4S binding protein [bacterium]